MERLARFIALPELKIRKVYQTLDGSIFHVEKVSEYEVCPRSATRSWGTYYRRWITVRDAPIRNRGIELKIRKRRFWCKPCRKPFTEPIAGIGKGQRTTERYRASLLWACDNFESLTRARKYMRCSTSTLYRLYYRQLVLELRKRHYPWPKHIGIDEHKTVNIG